MKLSSLSANRLARSVVVCLIAMTVLFALSSSKPRAAGNVTPIRLADSESTNRAFATTGRFESLAPAVGRHVPNKFIDPSLTGYKNKKENFSNVTNLDVPDINQQIEVTGYQPDEELCSVTTKEIACKEDGSGTYLYTFTVTNNTGHVVTDVLLTPKANSSITINPQQPVLPAGGIASGASLTLSATISGGKPGEQACFEVTLMTADGKCCTTEVCPVLPDCCGIVRNVSIECNQDGTYTYTLSIVNTGVDTIEHIYLYPPAGVTMTPNYFPVSLKPGETFTTKVIIKGAKPGDTVCFDISLHTANMAKCCKGRHCILLPKCPVPGVH